MRNQTAFLKLYLGAADYLIGASSTRKWQWDSTEVHPFVTDEVIEDAYEKLKF